MGRDDDEPQVKAISIEQILDEHSEMLVDMLQQLVEMFPSRFEPILQKFLDRVEFVENES